MVTLKEKKIKLANNNGKYQNQKNNEKKISMDIVIINLKEKKISMDIVIINLKEKKISLVIHIWTVKYQSKNNKKLICKEEI